MNAKFKFISTMLIIILTILLVVILVNYYNKPIEVNNDVVNDFVNANQTSGNVIGENLIGEEPKDDKFELSGDVSGEGLLKLSGEKTSENQPTTNNQEVINKGDSKPVIITSEDTMTSKEKREILTELDNTLMELLEVVDRVQTIDESRLITNESEVQE